MTKQEIIKKANSFRGANREFSQEMGPIVEAILGITPEVEDNTEYADTTYGVKNIGSEDGGSANGVILVPDVVVLDYEEVEETVSEETVTIKLSTVDVIGNVDYATDPTDLPEKIYIKTCAVSPLVSTIRFQSGETPMSFEYEEGILLWANDEVPEIEASSEYLLAICNGIAVMTKIKSLDPETEGE